MSIYVSRANKRGGSSSPVTPNNTTSSSMEEVKAKLNFSLANRSPLVKTSSRMSPYNVHNNKYHLREYHMSRQDPAVLDHMYFSNSHLDSTLHKSPPDTFNRPRHQTMGLPSAPLARAGQRQSVVMAALRKHVLTNNRSPPGVSSIVRLASQGSATSSHNLTISPVVVNHSPINNKPLLDVTKLSTVSPPSNLPPRPDPCDKNVVVSALKQKSRKRWLNKADNHSLPDGDQSGLSQPVAKKSKPMYYYVRDQLTNNTTSHEAVGGVKRSNMASSVSTGTLPKKHALEAKRNRICLPDPDIEDNSQLSSSQVTVATEESEIIDCSDPAKEEALLKLKQKLTQVFPSPSSGPSSCKRKKRPVYCATGSVMPLPPPSAYPVTAEDLRKDREEGLARIRRYLLSDNDSNQVSAENKTQQVSSLALSTSSSALLSAGPLPTITTTTATIGNSITLGKGLSVGVSASASAPSILSKPVSTSVGGSLVLGELGKLSGEDIAKQSLSGPSFATSAASLLPTDSNCNLVSSSKSAAMLSFPSSVSSSSVSASPMLCSQATSNVSSSTTLVSGDASASSVINSSCSKAANTGFVIDNSNISNGAQSIATSESVSGTVLSVPSSVSGMPFSLNSGLPLASGQQLSAAKSSSVLTSQASSIQGFSSLQLPGTALPLNLQPQALTSNSQTQQASTVASVSQSTNQSNMLLSLGGLAQQSVASSKPSITFGQQLNKPIASQQTVGMLFGTLQTSTSQTSQLGAQQPSATVLQQQPSTTGLQQQPSGNGNQQQPSGTGNQQQPSGTGIQQLSGFGLQQQPLNTGLQQPLTTGLSGFGLQQQSSSTSNQQPGLSLQQSATGLLSFGLQQQSSTTGQQPSATAHQQPSATGLQQPSATGLLGFGLQQQSSTTGKQSSATGLQQPSATGLLGFGLQKQSSNTGQQLSTTGLLGFGLQQQSTTGQQPSAPGLQQPLSTGLQQPSATGLLGFGLQQQPSASRLQQPSGTGFGIQLSGGTKTVQFSATTQSSDDQTIGSPMQQASANTGSVMFGANKSAVGEVMASQQGSIFGGNNLLQSSGQRSVNLFGGASTSTSSAQTFQFGSSSIQSSNLFGGNNTASISTASSMATTFKFGQSQQNSTNTTTGSTFQFGLSQTAAPSNLFGAQNQQKSMSGFSFSLGTQQQQQQQPSIQLSSATGQLSEGMSNKSSAPALGGFNFSANQSATNLFGSQSSSQQLMASSTSGFNFSAAAQTPSFNFAAGGNSKPSISRSNSKTALRRRKK